MTEVHGIEVDLPPFNDIVAEGTLLADQYKFGPVDSFVFKLGCLVMKGYWPRGEVRMVFRDGE